jgi:hypothetical protein
MTKPQILWITGFYFVELVVVAYFTRATTRRVLGALFGGAVVAPIMIMVIILVEKIGWWHVPFSFEPGYVSLFYIGTVISCSPMYLITWRVGRRFGWKGPAVCVIIAAIIGPPRDYLIAAIYPEWMVFAPGIAPIIADAVAYAGLVALGHTAMRVVAGSVSNDRLAKRTGQSD